MTIQEIKNKQNGEMIVPPGLTARCVQVEKQTTGSGQWGKWSVQQLLVNDTTGEMRIAVWHRPELSELKGKLLQFMAFKSDKGFSGCIIEQKETKDGGEIYNQLKLSKTGIIQEVIETNETSAAQTSDNQNGRRGIEWWDYIQAMRGAHTIAAELEPDDIPGDPDARPKDRSTARAALVNTMMISLSMGQLSLPPKEPEGPKDDDSIPF